jgi:hypothetical protein
MSVRMNKAFLALSAVLLLLQPINYSTGGTTPIGHEGSFVSYSAINTLAPQAGTQSGGISKYSDSENKKSLEFDRRRLWEIFGIAENTNDNYSANTKLSGADKLSLMVNPPMPRHTMSDEPVMQNLQERIEKDKRCLAQDMELLMPHDNSNEASAELRTRLKDFADQSGVKIIQTNTLPDKKEGDLLTKVGVHLETTCVPEQIVKFLAAIRNYPKSLKVEDISIYSRPVQRKTDGWGRGVAGGGLGGMIAGAIDFRNGAPVIEFRADLTVSGYIGSEPSERPSESAALIQAEALEARIKAIEDILCKRDMNLEILKELTEILPIDTCLSSYAYRDGNIRLNGISRSASDLIQKLEESPLLKDVASSGGPYDPQPGKERFNFGAKLQ